MPYTVSHANMKYVMYLEHGDNRTWVDYHIILWVKLYNLLLLYMGIVKNIYYYKHYYVYVLLQGTLGIYRLYRTLVPLLV
jgi:hypothetical protein